MVLNCTNMVQEMYIVPKYDKMSIKLYIVPIYDTN